MLRCIKCGRVLAAIALPQFTVTQRMMLRGMLALMPDTLADDVITALDDKDAIGGVLGAECPEECP